MVRASRVTSTEMTLLGVGITEGVAVAQGARARAWAAASMEAGSAQPRGSACPFPSHCLVSVFPSFCPHSFFLLHPLPFPSMDISQMPGQVWAEPPETQTQWEMETHRLRAIWRCGPGAVVPGRAGPRSPGEDGTRAAGEGTGPTWTSGDQGVRPIKGGEGGRPKDR